MKVEIWSDVMCPFCYIGKRRFEGALSQFEHKNSIEIVWKSFQLNPGMKTDPDKNINQYLAEIKGWTLEHAKQMNDHVTGMAREVGLDYDFDKAIVANSFDAHRFVQLAKKHNLGDAAEEVLFKAYFTEGKNIADPETLIELGSGIGLDRLEIKEMLNGTAFSEAVHQEVDEAQKLGIRGVPFYVMDRKYGVSGAQSSEVFLQTLNTSFGEWQQKNAPVLDIADGKVCTPEGDCN